MIVLGQSNNFSVELWENLLVKINKAFVEEALNQTGNGHLKQKFDTAVVETESFLAQNGQNFFKLINMIFCRNSIINPAKAFLFQH